MSEKPLISVVVPVYNVAKYLKKSIESIVNQTYTNLEIILVDDGSKDESGEICEDYSLKDSRIIVIHKPNGGLSDARNASIKQAKGEYITFVDSDDTIDYDMIEFLYDLILKFHTKMSICCQTEIFENTNKKNVIGNNEKLKLTGKECIRRMLYHDIVDTSAWAKLSSTELFKTVKFPKGKIYEDIATTYKLFQKCDYVACGFESKYNYMVRNDSLTRVNFSENKFQLLEMTDKMGVDVVKIYPDLADAVLRRRVYARFALLNNMLDIDESFIPARANIVNFILDNKKVVLTSNCVPLRDKVGIIALMCGFCVYRFMWNVYTYIKK